MTDTLEDIDLELIYSLGDEPERKCEHSRHNVHQYGHSDHSSLSYVKIAGCTYGVPENIKSFCDSYLAYVVILPVLCIACDERLSDHYTILGPVE